MKVITIGRSKEHNDIVVNDEKVSRNHLQMVKDGFAWHYKYYDSTPAYAEAEKEARAAKRGLWQDPNPIQPYEFRKKQRNFGIR